jgi:hypothetical protein
MARARSFHVGEIAVAATGAAPGAEARLASVVRRAFTAAAADLAPWLDREPGRCEIPSLAIELTASLDDDEALLARLREQFALALRRALTASSIPSFASRPDAADEQSSLPAAVLRLVALAGGGSADAPPGPLALLRWLLARDPSLHAIGELDEREALSALRWLAEGWDAAATGSPAAPAAGPAAGARESAWIVTALRLRLDGPWHGADSARARLALAALLLPASPEAWRALMTRSASLLAAADALATLDPARLAPPLSPGALVASLRAAGAGPEALAATAEWAPHLARAGEALSALVGERAGDAAASARRWRTSYAGLALVAGDAAALQLDLLAARAGLAPPARGAFVRRVFAAVAGVDATVARDAFLDHLAGDGSRALPDPSANEPLREALLARASALRWAPPDEPPPADAADLAAALLLRRLARRLRRLEQASFDWLRRQLVVVPGRARERDRAVELVLHSVPLGVLLQVTGLGTGEAALPWARPPLLRHRLEV